MNAVHPITQGVALGWFVPSLSGSRETQFNHNANTCSRLTLGKSARKPSNGSPLKVVEQCLNRYARPNENGRAAHDLRIAVDDELHGVHDSPPGNDITRSYYRLSRQNNGNNGLDTTVRRM